MKYILNLLLFLVSLNYAYAGVSEIKLSTDSGEVVYSLPTGWCNITETETGKLLFAYIQDVINSSKAGVDARLILKKCDSSNEVYPWGYVGLKEVDKLSGAPQSLINKNVKDALYLGVLDNRLKDIEKAHSKLADKYFDLEMTSDSSSLNKSKILREDKNSITFSTEYTSYIEAEKITEFVITSLTLAKEQVIGTYLYNIDTSVDANKPTIDAVLSNAKKIADANRSKSK